MTLSQKKNIDILTPTLATAGLAFYFFRKGGKVNWKLLAGMLVLTFVVVYVVTTKITKASYAKSLDVPLTPDGSGCSSYNAGALALAIHTEMSSWGTYNGTPYEQLLALNDCQFQSVYNAWNASFPGSTLRVALNAYNPWSAMSFNSSILPSLNDRFSRLNMI